MLPPSARESHDGSASAGSAGSGRDVKTRFDKHLKGLLASFLALQQQKHELELRLGGLSQLEEQELEQEEAKLQEMKAGEVLGREGTREVFDIDLAVPPEREREVADVVEKLRVEMPDEILETSVGKNGEDCQGLDLMLASKSLASTGFGRDRRLMAQFHRLDCSSTGRVHEKDLQHVVQCHYSSRELGNIGKVIDYLTGVKEDTDHPHEVSHRGRTSAPLRSSAQREGLDYEAFVRLVDDEELPGAPRGVRCDVVVLREALKEEDTFTLYKDDGHWGQGGEDEQAAESKGRLATFLDYGPAIVISINALSIGLSSEIEPNSPFWEVLEWLFLIFYTFEAALKMKLFGVWTYLFGKDRNWNRFDLICILTSVSDFSVRYYVRFLASGDPVGDLSTLMLIKMLRLARLARLVRTLRFPIFRELKLMVMGVFSGIRVLIWAIALLVVLIYVVGVALTNLIGSDVEEFVSLDASMFTLFRCFTDGCAAYDGTPLPERLRKMYGVGFFIGYILMFMFVTIGVFNLIMAIFIDNVMNSQLDRKQQDISNTADKVEVKIKEHLIRLMLMSRMNGVPQHIEDEVRLMEDVFETHAARVRAQFDILKDEEIIITRSAFMVWLKDEMFLKVLNQADVDICNKQGLFDVMDADMTGWLSFDEVFTGLMKLRGPVSKGDIIALFLRITHITKVLHAMGGNERDHE